MPNYVPKKESTYTLYEDANNPFGCSMIECVQYGKLKFEDDFEIYIILNTR